MAVSKDFCTTQFIYFLDVLSALQWIQYDISNPFQTQDAETCSVQALITIAYFQFNTFLLGFTI